VARAKTTADADIKTANREDVVERMTFPGISEIGLELSHNSVSASLRDILYAALKTWVEYHVN
jgi:hypothetical protein